MKKRYDRKAVSRHFAPGDQVMVLLPVLGSALQVRYTGPYHVERRVGDLNYAIATPDRRKKSRLCHVNMLKPYCARRPARSCSKTSPAAAEGRCPKAELSTRPSAEVAAAYILSDVAVVSEPPPDMSGPSMEVIEGRLKNSAILKDLPSFLSHLSDAEQADLTALILSHQDLFTDVPRCTTAIEHDIEVECTKPIKQHPYRANPLKRQVL